MRIVVIGAYGLIGSYVTARLLADGHAVVGVGRDLVQARRRFPAVDWKAADLRTASIADWTALLAGADAVVNCAGALQDGPRDDLKAVHAAAVARIVEACEATGTRLVHISAVGVAPGRADPFGATKQLAEALIAQSRIAWIVLRPGLVIAPAAYGGTALLRALAAFPLLIPAVHAQARVQTVAADEVAAAVALAVQPETPAGQSLDLVHAEQVPLADILTRLRAWIGLAPAPVLNLPAALAAIPAKVADALAFLGWRSPLRSTALEQLSLGVAGNAADAERLGLSLKSLDQTLAAMPSGVQERWFAKAWLAKPLILATLCAFWLVSGLIGLTVSRDAAIALLTSAHLPEPLAQAFVVGGGVVDVALALLVAHRRTARLALLGMIAVTIGYLTGGAIVRPDLWLDPLGPLVKSIPAAVLALAALAILDER
ncbi:SDR family oxidoreductase [Caulobacter hibisci]|uniref:SDR family oxidoreductase n=1 Tax=Caulobacter hibisci TaxID=2035993 RepID=A0ABS0SWF5_9CAUL|nr:SDR family oxidoreductase [Caulobacter hibisci]MBI1683874.1 SDR family oxidoreductase [Caulobacter hibisci]